MTDDKRIKDRSFMRSVASSLIAKGLFEFGKHLFEIITSYFD